jgi:hypothetical protein
VSSTLQTRRKLAVVALVAGGFVVSFAGYCWLLAAWPELHLHREVTFRLGFICVNLCVMAALVFFTSAIIALVGRWRGWTSVGCGRAAYASFTFAAVYWLFFGTPPFTNPYMLSAVIMAFPAGQLTQFFASRVPTEADTSVVTPVFRQFPWY